MVCYHMCNFVTQYRSNSVLILAEWEDTRKDKHFSTVTPLALLLISWFG